MKKASFQKQILNGKCIDLSYEGKGVFKCDNNVVFVNDMFPEEEGDIEIDYRRNGQFFGHVKKLTKKSIDREAVRCPYFYQCGGCQFQDYAYKAQLEFKRKKVQEQFRKLAHMDIKPLATLGMDHPEGYRNKVQPLLGKDERGNIYSGFYKAGTHIIVPIEKCLIEDDRATKVLASVRKLMKSFHIEPYDEDSGYGVMRHILIKTSYYYPEIMVVLITAVDSFPSRNNFIRALIKDCPSITTIVENINSRHTSVVLGEKTRVLYGKGYIQDTLCDIHFRISAKSFYQTNPVMTEILYKTAMEFAELTKNDVVFDAYSGIGTIGLIAAKDAKKVIAGEMVPEAVRDAKENAKYNHIDNFYAYADDASSFIYKMVRNHDHIDVLFMDPPRKGSDEKFLKAVLAIKPSRIVYISCDPSSLARDVAFLSRGYEVKKVQPVDMFPQTFHVETIVLLQRKMSRN